MKHYQLLPMDRTHLLDVAALERECFTTPWTEEMLAEELFNDTASFLVAQADDGEVLGYAGLHVVLDEGYIDNIAVKAKYRRLGVAGELLGAFLRFGQANLAFLTLEVRPSNKPAIAFYLKHGFAQVGRRRDYYDKPREDAILMTREFSR